MTVCYWCGAKDTLADIGKELDDGKYKMVQCSKCKNAYYVVNREKMNKPKPQTNEEWLKQANTEQLAEFLFKMACCCSMCGDESQDTWKKVMSCPFGKTVCIKNDWKVWLKQPHQ